MWRIDLLFQVHSPITNNAKINPEKLNVTKMVSSLGLYTD